LAFTNTDTLFWNFNLVATSLMLMTQVQYIRTARVNFVTFTLKHWMLH